MASPQRDPFALCGTTIDGKYRVLSIVGEGGFGVVYRGLDEGFGEPVAIKCLKLPPYVDAAAQDELIAKLREEGRLLRRLSQRTTGILQAHDAGSFTTPTGVRVPYLVLEWLEGRTLSAELKARAARGEIGMSPAQAFAMLDPAAEALEVAHAEKIAHRDIKPENLFLVESGDKSSMKVLDFGIAKILADAPSPAEAVTSSGPTAFTPNYGAPEQFDKTRGASGPWTDVFAFALVFVEVVSGRRALSGDQIHELYLSTVDPALRPTLRACGVTASDAVERVLSKALAVDPRNRYITLGAFWKDLAAALKDEPDITTAPTQVAPPSGERAASMSTAEYAVASGISVGPATTTAPSEVPSRQAPSGQLPAASGAASTGAAAQTGVSAKTGVKDETVTVPAKPGPSRAMVPVAVAAVLAIAAVVWKLAGSVPPSPAGLPTADPSPAASTATATDSVPFSKNAEALSLYKEAMHAAHDGDLDVPIQLMERATQLDREFAAAHLRLVMWKSGLRREEVREHHQAAQRFKESLSEHDRELLHAMEPYVRQPWDPEEWEKRLTAMSVKFPRDAELFSYLAAARFYRMRIDAAIEACDRALEIDRGTVPAWTLKGELLAMKGDPKAQLALYQQCLEANPSAMSCLSSRVSVSASLGECQIMRDDAKRLAANTPKAASAHRLLGVALQATGAPSESVLLALERSASLESPDEQKPTSLGYRVDLAEAAGDFDSARKLLEEWQSAVSAKPDQNAHGAPALELARLYREMGAPRRSEEVAADFLKRMSAWTEPVEGDWKMSFLTIRRQAGTLSPAEYAQGRSEWLETFRSKWKAAGRTLTPESDWMGWSSAYGEVAETEADAREAIANLPAERSPVAESGRLGADLNVNVGKVHLLAGQLDRAIPPLRRVVDSCLALTDPLLFTRARLYLGMALEGQGDVAGARAAYERVIEQWGKARPRSVTAEKAAQRLKSLPKPG